MLRKVILRKAHICLWWEMGSSKSQRWCRISVHFGMNDQQMSASFQSSGSLVLHNISTSLAKPSLAPPPPTPWSQFVSFSCNFLGKIAKIRSCCDRWPLWEFLDPRLYTKRLQPEDLFARISKISVTRNPKDRDGVSVDPRVSCGDTSQFCLMSITSFCFPGGDERVWLDAQDVRGPLQPAAHLRRVRRQTAQVRQSRREVRHAHENLSGSDHIMKLFPWSSYEIFTVTAIGISSYSKWRTLVPDIGLRSSPPKIQWKSLWPLDLGRLSQIVPRK